jgi:transposase
LEKHICRAVNRKAGLKDKPRRGRPPDVPKEKLSKISEISENPSGCKAKDIMNIIRKTGIRYHEVHIYRLLKWKATPNVRRKEIHRYGIRLGERSIQRKTRLLPYMVDILAS